MFELLPEELLYQILAIRQSVHYDVFANRSSARLLVRRTGLVHLLLVCQRWRRVATPLVYETIVIASLPQASTLASILRQGPFGSYVKKLRIEGGFGEALHTILSHVPRLVYLFLSLEVSSKAEGAGLCTGLKLINPQYVILRDNLALGNQGVRSVVDTLITCMTTLWTNMISYDHPYDEYLWVGHEYNTPYVARAQRARDLAKALAHIPKLKIVYVPRAYYICEDGVVLSALKNPSVQKIFSWIAWQERFSVPLDRYPRLRDIIYLRLPGPWSQVTYAPIGQGDSSSVLQTTFKFSDQGPMFWRSWADHW